MEDAQIGHVAYARAPPGRARRRYYMRTKEPRESSGMALHQQVEKMLPNGVHDLRGGGRRDELNRAWSVSTCTRARATHAFDERWSRDR
jgi:hypothetical protein